MFATHLACRSCGKERALGAEYYCDECFGPLEVRYDYAAIRQRVTRAHIAAGPTSIWRYGALLPIARKPVDLETGWTPLLRADRLGRELGLRNLWIKNDSVNPTFSFKHRNVPL